MANNVDSLITQAAEKLKKLEQKQREVIAQHFELLSDISQIQKAIAIQNKTLEQLKGAAADDR